MKLFGIKLTNKAVRTWPKADNIILLGASCYSRTTPGFVMGSQSPIPSVSFFFKINKIKLSILVILVQSY
jgi:hypothetical protein